MTSPHTEQESDLSLPDLPPGLTTLKTFICLYTTHIHLSWTQTLVFICVCVSSIMRSWLWVLCFASLAKAGADGTKKSPRNLGQSARLAIHPGWSARGPLWWTAVAVVEEENRLLCSLRENSVVHRWLQWHDWALVETLVWKRANLMVLVLYYLHSPYFPFRNESGPAEAFFLLKGLKGVKGSTYRCFGPPTRLD